VAGNVSVALTVVLVKQRMGKQLRAVTAIVVIVKKKNSKYGKRRCFDNASCIYNKEKMYKKPCFGFTNMKK